MIELPTVKICLEQFRDRSRIRQRIGTRALVDTGTSHSLVSNSLLSNRNFTSTPLVQPLKISNALNQTSSNIIFRKISINIHFPEQRKTLCDRDLLIVSYDMKYPVIIGMDILQNKTLRLTNFVQINAINAQVEPCTVNIESNDVNPDKNTTLLVATSTSFLPPMETIHAKCDIMSKSKVPKGTKFHITTCDALKKQGCVVRKTHEAGRLTTQISNLTKTPVMIKPNARLAVLTEKPNAICSEEDFDVLCNALIRVEDMDDKHKRIHYQELQQWRSWRSKLMKEVPLTTEIDMAVSSAPIKYQKDLQTLLEKYNSIFSRSASDSGFNPTFAVRLTFKDGVSKQPCFSKPYKLEKETAQLLEAKVTEMIESGILEKTSSSWNSPCLGIKKKGGGIRLVNNFSAPKDLSVNARLSTTNFPIPSIRNLNQTISSTIARLRANHPTENIVMGSLDLRNAFYNLCIVSEDRDITAFIAASI